MRFNKLLIAVSLILSGTFIFAQGDGCSTATNLGTLPTPGACVSGLQTGGSITPSGTTVGSTADNPYVYQTGCQGSGGSMDFPANDVWYSFTASGSVLNLSISGLSNANIGLWSGGCGNLAGNGCMTTPNNGNGSMVVSQLVAGQVYYISVTSSDDGGGNDGAFNLTISNDIDCDDCLLSGALTSSPAPVNGGYAAGDVVTFCYTITGWDQQNTNWLHGVQLSFGAGWTGAVTNASPANTVQNLPGPGCNGAWAFYATGIGVANGTNWGTGFYFDTQCGSTPMDNYGDNCQGTNCSWTFCWDLTVGPCTPGMDLGVTVNTSGDGESGTLWLDNGCTDDDATVFSAIGICCPAPVMISSPVSCFGLCNGSATADGAGILNDGIGPWDYVWEDAGGSTVFTQNNVNGTSTATGLCAGTYNVIVTDANNCTSIASVVVATPTLLVSSEAHVNPLCFGGTTTATITASGSTAPYNVSWTGTTSGNPGGTEINASGGTYNMTGLGVGTYNVTVTDAAGCVSTVTVIIITPPLLVASDVETNVTCFGGNDGNGAVTATGGTAPYNVSWTGTTSGNPGGTEIAASGGTYNMTGLVAGTYNVTVTDANGCTATTTVNIADGIVVTAAFTQPVNQCLTGNSFTFTNTSTNGTAYSWNFGGGGASPATSTAFSPAGVTYTTPGTYTVTLTVTNGACSDVATFNITVYPMPVPTAFADSVLCNGGATGSATVNAPAYITYDWANILTPATTVSTSNPAIGLVAGTYTATITDGNSCPGTVNVTVFEPPVLAPTAVFTNPICNGDATGTAIATGVGGTAGYSYSWNTIPVQNTAVATGLVAGTYICTVTDYSGCTQTVSVTLVNPAGMVLTPTMTAANCGLPDGDASVTVTSGGVGPFTYSWNTVPVQNTQTAINIAAATYTVVVTDVGTGCTEDTVITVSTTAGITATATFIQDALCNGSSDGQAYAVPTGGAPVYTYSWNTVPVQTNDTLVAPAGTYTVVITDGSGCTGSDVVVIGEPTPVVATIPTHNDPSCFGSNDGDATAAGAGGVGGYTYSWNTVPIQTSNPAIGLVSAALL